MTDLWTHARVGPTSGRRADDLGTSTSLSTTVRATSAQRGCSIFGWTLLAVGAVVVGCTWSPHPLDHRVVDLLGLDHTIVLGVIEIASGSVLLAAASSRDAATPVGIAVGLAMWMGGIGALAESRTVELVLGAGAAHGCVSIAAGATLVSSSLLSICDGSSSDAGR